MNIADYVLVIFLAFFIIVVLACSGCVTKPIPVTYNCPTLKLPPEPYAPTSKLNDNSAPSDVIRAYVATAKAYKGWCRIVQKQVSS